MNPLAVQCGFKSATFRTIVVSFPTQPCISLYDCNKMFYFLLVFKVTVKSTETQSFYGNKSCMKPKWERPWHLFFGMQLFLHLFLQQEQYHILHKQRKIQEEIENITFWLKTRQKCYIKIMKTSCKIMLFVWLLCFENKIGCNNTPSIQFFPPSLLQKVLTSKVVLFSLRSLLQVEIV